MERIPSNGTVLTRLDPGSRTIALRDLTPNCTIDGASSRTVTVVDPEVVAIEFAVVCTATSGVIGVTVVASGTDVEGDYIALVDGAPRLGVSPGEPHYLTGIAAGRHLISLRGPRNCSVTADPQPVTVTVGELIRDTVEVVFLVTCVQRGTGTVRITAPTTGQLPSSIRYEVWYESFGYWDYGGTPTFLGALHPNGTLVVELPASGSDPTGGSNYWYWFELKDVPGKCSVQNPNPGSGFTITNGDTLDVKFTVMCSP